MPHVVIEYGLGSEHAVDMQTICGQVFDALAAHDAFPDPSVIKVRAAAFDTFHVGCAPQSFVHAALYLMSGRDVQTRKQLNQIILDVLVAALPQAGSSTVRDVELPRETYAKYPA